MVPGGRVSELANPRGQGLVGDSCEGRESAGEGKMVVRKQQRGPTCLPLRPEPLLPQRLQGKRDPLGGVSSFRLRWRVEGRLRGETEEVENSRELGQGCGVGRKWGVKAD